VNRAEKVYVHDPDCQERENDEGYKTENRFLKGQDKSAENDDARDNLDDA